MSAPQGSGLLIIDPGTSHPELGCVRGLAEEARALGLGAQLCLPALPEQVERCAAELDPALVGGVGSLELLEAFDPRELAGVIILGSGANPSDVPAWQAPLGRWLAGLLAQPSAEATPLLAICYGHQLLAQLHGITVGRLWEGEKASGLRRAGLDDERLGVSGSCELIVSHRDGFTSLPQGWESLCSGPALLSRPSASGPLQPVPGVEAMRHQLAPWWGFQAHIEAEQSFISANEVEAQLPEPYDGQRLTRAFLALCASS